MILCLLGWHRWTSWLEIAETNHYIRHCNRCPMANVRIGSDEGR